MLKLIELENEIVFPPEVNITSQIGFPDLPFTSPLKTSNILPIVK